ncbi:MAG TPA: ion channel [Polyangia bacterium]|jgi:inward rectifier potassium channel|nr:ion channel [Polyangia bacterium]
MARRPSTFLGVERRNIRRAPLADLYHSLMARSWGRLLGLLAVIYLLANVVFALLYRLGGDCIAGAHSFRDLFFFSVQTLSTIGYGTMTPQTTWAHVLVTFQAFGGTLFVAIVTGLVFSKFSRPTARVMFSKNVVLIERGGKRLLQFRMANQRANQIVEAQLRVAMARNEIAPDGERMRRFHDLVLQRDRNVIFVLTWTAVHEIDERSPLHGLSLPDMKAQSLQLIGSLIGLDETFSQQVHARHTYVPDDFVFDMRFADIIGTEPDGSRYVDYARFDTLVPMGTKTEIA